MSLVLEAAVDFVIETKAAAEMITLGGPNNGILKQYVTTFYIHWAIL